MKGGGPKQFFTVLLILLERQEAPGFKSGFLYDVQYLQSYPENPLPKTEKDKFFLFALFTDNPEAPIHFGKTSVLMPKTYRNFHQHNQHF